MHVKLATRVWLTSLLALQQAAACLDFGIPAVLYVTLGFDFIIAIALTTCSTIGTAARTCHFCDLKAQLAMYFECVHARIVSRIVPYLACKVGS